MSVKAWADHQRQYKWQQDDEDQRMIDTFQGLLEGNMTPNTAAGIISSLYEPLIKLHAKNSAAGNLWGIFCRAAQVFGGNKELNERLVDLLDLISELPDVTDRHGNSISASGNEYSIYWRDLPDFGITFREYAVDTDDPSELSESDWNNEAMFLLNITTFGALYLARGKMGDIMTFHADLSLICGLEEEIQTPDELREAEMWVPASATWILIAGEKIHELCKNDARRRDGTPDVLAPEDKFRWGLGSGRGRGYSLGRWTFWKERFDEIAKTQGLTDGVKDLAARAKSEMIKIESQTK